MPSTYFLSLFSHTILVLFMIENIGAIILKIVTRNCIKKAVLHQTNEYFSVLEPFLEVPI